MAGKGPDIVVVGAGIIGASIAWHLTRAGASVTILEAGTPGGVATPASFAWINSNHSFGRGYFELRHHSMGEWRRLAEALPQVPVSRTGSVYLPSQGLDLEEFVARNAAWGYRIELIGGGEVKRLEPCWKQQVETAARAHDEGAAEAQEVAVLLVAAAAEAGAQLRAGMKAEGLVLNDGRITGVRAGGETWTADEVVVAAGVAAPGLVAETGFSLPLTTPPGLLVHTRPVGPVLNGVVLADGLHVRQKANGQVVAGADFEGGELADTAGAGAEELMRRLDAALDTKERLVLDRHTVGYRPMPGDGRPVIGRLPGVEGLYVAVMHSGVTLCPAVGAFAARELLQGERAALLAPFGPERFAEARPGAMA